MAATLPVTGLEHVSVVVEDLRAAAERYATVYGIDRWQVAHHTAERLRDSSAFGFAAEYSYATATGANRHGVRFRLVQPTGGMSTFAHFLVTRGEGIHGLCPAVLDQGEFDALGGLLDRLGIRIAQAATVEGADRHYFLDTRRLLGGFYLEVVVRLSSTPSAAGAHGDEEWRMNDRLQGLPAAGALRQLPGIGHFGVVVTDLMERLPGYARLLGLTRWSFVHFHPGPGSLERSTLDGQEVKHAFLLATASTGSVGFELIQPTMEPTHYRRELLDRIGEGIHHLLVLPGQSAAEWPSVRRWMESLGAPVAMSGSVRAGSAEFFYLDTRRLLGGYLLEAICREEGAPPARREPDFTFDFSEEAGLRI